MLKITRHTLNLTGTCLAMGSLICCSGNKSAHTENKDHRPNIILFFTDDNDFSYWGFGGGPDLSPCIDSIAAAGITASQFYCTSSVCTPSRYSLHTGKYAGRCTHEEFHTAFPEDQPYNIIWNTFLDPQKEKTLGQLLQEAGYFTGFVGKWHLGFDFSPFNIPKNGDPFNPLIDSLLKAQQKAVVSHVEKTGFNFAASVVPANFDDDKVDALQYHNLEWIAKGALGFLDTCRKQEKPFFLIVNITTHHGPCHTESIDHDIRVTPEGIVDGLKGIMPPRETIYERIMEKGFPVDFKTAGTVWTDDLVHSVLSRANKIFSQESTAVVFTTDHNRFDGKATCYQGGIHIPFLMKWPGKIPAGSHTGKRMQIIDLLPTFLAMAESKENPIVDGQNRLNDLLNPVENQPDHEVLYFEFGYTRAVLKDNWKYIAFRLPPEHINEMKSGKTSKAIAFRGTVFDEPCIARYPWYFDADQLYDLSKDPDEQYNLANDPAYQGILLQMQENLLNVTQTFSNPFPVKEPDPFMLSSDYMKLVKAAKNINLEQFYWYRKACY